MSFYQKGTRLSDVDPLEGIQPRRNGNFNEKQSKFKVTFVKWPTKLERTILLSQELDPSRAPTLSA